MKKNNSVFKIMILIVIIIIVLILFYAKQPNQTLNNEENSTPEDIIEKIVITDIDGKDRNYSFTYNGEIFKATYTYDHWKIYDSYKIRNMNDIKNICQKLINIHPIHGKDRLSYRTAEDMAYEWLQHNLAYDILPDNNKWRKNAKDVDLDPDDQGRSMKEIYEDRTGEKFNIDSIIK